MEKLSKLDDKINDELVRTNGTEEQFQAEYTEVSTYLDKFEAAQMVVQSMSKNDAGNGKPVSSKKQENYHLPRLELKKFGGDPKDWIAFWSQFKTIHENEDINPEEKFQYLIQSTIPKSTARSVVESFPPSAENYPKVMKYLESRFGREEILVEVYVRELLGLVINNIQKRGAFTISSIYDKLETQLRSLESLGVTSDKYAAMLYPLVESSLPEDILRAWERSRIHLQKDGDTELTSLLLFIRSEVESEERIRIAKRGFGTSEVKGQKSESQNIPTITDLYVGQEESPVEDKICIFCDKKHDSSSCFQAPKMTIEEKQKKIMEKRACFVCLKKNHISKKCKSKIKCPVCERRHLVIMCPGLTGQRECSNKDSIVKKELEVPTLANSTYDNILLQTLVIRVCNGKQEKIVRALIDMGSQLSYVTVQLAKSLNLQNSDELTLGHGLFGGEEIKNVFHKVYHVNTWSWKDHEKLELPIMMRVLDQPKICGPINRIPPGPWVKELTEKGVIVSDLGYDKPEIHMLIGADIAGELLTGNIIKTKSGPVALETKLGWVMMGSCPADLQRNKNGTYSATTTMNSTIQNLWRLDILGIRDPIEVKSEEKMIQDAIQQFQKSVQVNQDGRYEVSLPWKTGHLPIESTLELSRKRLNNVIRKLEETNQDSAYLEIFNEWEQSGIIERVPDNECNFTGFVMPHRPKFNHNSKTTPIRPVFDASARTKSSISLNDALLKGPNLLEMIPAVLTRFRLRRCAVTADIKKAFLQISVRKEDRKFLRFLCWEKKDDGKRFFMYQHSRVVFGVSSSPFLLAATLSHHLEAGSGNMENTKSILRNSFYVDNLLVSMDTEEEIKRFKEESIKIMRNGMFELREWAQTGSSEIEVEEKDFSVSVLGLEWNVKYDTLRLMTGRVDYKVEEPITMRKIAGIAQKIFDPLGICSPVTLIPKLMIQKLWELKTGWDKEAPIDITKDFLKWLSYLPCLSEVEIPRWIMEDNITCVNLSFHLFCDASSYGYGYGIYLRSEKNGNVTVQLLQGKAKVAPKKSTIPRLELLACFFGSRALVEVMNDLKLENASCVCWTDSSNALYWIKNNENWSVFVFNRVEEIRRLIGLEAWRHLPGKENPADLPSRGCNGNQLVNSRWWEGPLWLRLSEEEWPTSKINTDMDKILHEMKKTTKVVVSKILEQPWFITRYSSFSKTVAVIARILRWRHITQRKVFPMELTEAEKEYAEKLIWKIIQERTLYNRSQLKQQHARKDSEGLRRVRSKIIMRDDHEYFRFPILLPYGHVLVKNLIREVHLVNKHAGVNTLMSILREKYWIVKTRRMVKEVVHACVRCRRWNAKSVEVEEAPLPVDRVREAEVFEIVGVDLGGPLHIRRQRKVWFAVFSCAVSRAVHLELVSDMSTNSFLLALRRFVARRGRPKVIYSDNGRNFVGLENMMKELNWSNICNKTGLNKIEWRFNPPAAPWWGGFWERMVGLVKDMLRKNLSNETLSYEELQTLLTEIEDIINRRPLTYVSEDLDDPIPLTPFSLMGKERPHGTPDLNCIDATTLRRKFGKLEKLRQALWSRFRSEYLGALVHNDRSKMKKMIKIGDVVILAVEGLKRGKWPLARVLELIPGRDGLSRMAVVKTATGTFTRAVQCLYPMELDASVDINKLTVGA